MLNNTGARAVAAHLIDPVARVLLRLRVSPDAVTLVGTVGVSAGALGFYPRQQWWVGTVVIAAFVFTDLVDGTMARMSGRQGPWGAFLDSTLDRVADGAVFGGLLLGFLHAGDDRTAAAALACLVGALVVSYAKARAESAGGGRATSGSPSARSGSSWRCSRRSCTGWASRTSCRRRSGCWRR